MRQTIDFSHVDVCRRLERSGALHSYPTGDDVSPFIRCDSSAHDAASLDQARRWLQTRVHRLAFERQNGKRAFMHTAQRLPFNEPLQGFDAERELA
jgi:hypothetical protein